MYFVLEKLSDMSAATEHVKTKNLYISAVGSLENLKKACVTRETASVLEVIQRCMSCFVAEAVAASLMMIVWEL